MSDVNDILHLASEVMRLIKARELERAVDLLADAQHKERAVDLEARQSTVHGINLNLTELRHQREQLNKTIAALPEAEQQFARTRIERICRELFDSQIATLQTRKRQLSRPSR